MQGQGNRLQTVSLEVGVFYRIGHVAGNDFLLSGDVCPKQFWIGPQPGGNETNVIDFW